MARNITASNIGDDTLDSSDIQELYDELDNEQEDLEEAIRDARADLKIARDAYDPEEGDEDIDEALTALDEAEKDLEHFYVENSGLMRDIEDAMEHVGEDWKYGVGLINERHWTEYVQDMMEEMGYINKDAWFIEVDWERTAENVAMDYATVELGDYTYYVRA